MNVLIVDDQPINLRLLRAILEAESYAVVEAADGIEALKILESGATDAIISDVLMPNMDGCRLCYEVRHRPALERIPFITYTSTYTSSSDEKMAFEAGTDKYLRKPAPARVILEALQDFAADPKYKLPRVETAVSEQDLMQSYSQALVRKLEERNWLLERAQEEILRANEKLEARVKGRTAELEAVNVELEAANVELEAFNFSVAHDLRAPLRAINGFSRLLLDDHGAALGPEGEERVERIRSATQRMNELIEQLLRLSRVNRCDTSRQRVDLSSLADMTLAELRRNELERELRTIVEPGIVAECDIQLMRIAFENLFRNAWKFTSKVDGAQIEFGSCEGATCYVRDNGAGFDMAYAEKLFSPFQRMHAQNDFPGTGLGLTIVQRIVTRHGGRIWAESAPGSGATFYLAL